MKGLELRGRKSKIKAVIKSAPRQRHGLRDQQLFEDFCRTTSVTWQAFGATLFWVKGPTVPLTYPDKTYKVIRDWDWAAGEVWRGLTAMIHEDGEAKDTGQRLRRFLRFLALGFNIVNASFPKQGTQYRPEYSMVLLMGTPKKVPLILGNP